MPVMTTEEIFADPVNFAGVPMMIGSTRDEMRLFMAFLPDYVETTGGFPTKIKDVAVFHRDARNKPRVKQVREWIFNAVSSRLEGVG